MLQYPIDPGTAVWNGRFMPQKNLSKRVFVGMDLNHRGVRVAAKAAVGKQQVCDLEHEARILQDLNLRTDGHQWFADYRTALFNGDDHAVPVTGLASSGTLAGFLERHGPQPYRAVHGFVQGVLQALCVMRRASEGRVGAVVHRSICPEACLLDAQPSRWPWLHRDRGAASLRLSAFSRARCIPDPSHLVDPDGFSGQRGFAAPELEQARRHGVEVDIYAVGAIIHFAVTGRLMEGDEAWASNLAPRARPLLPVLTKLFGPFGTRPHPLSLLMGENSIESTLGARRTTRITRSSASVSRVGGALGGADGDKMTSLGKVLGRVRSLSPARWAASKPSFDADQ